MRVMVIVKATKESEAENNPFDMLVKDQGIWRITAFHNTIRQK